MKITFLGSGSAFVLGHENYHSNILIESNEDNLLYDAGTTIADALYNANITPFDIKNIFISHNHADHSGGMEYIGYKTYFIPPFGSRRPILYGSYDILEELWENNLKAGMKSLTKATATLDTYFDVRYITDSFDVGDVNCTTIKTVHVEDDNGLMPSYGLFLNDSITNKKVYISGDSCCFSRRILMSADIIFQDCELAIYPNSVHTQYHELCTLPPEIKAKMWLYHYTTAGGTIELPDASKEGFLGFVKRGDTYDY